MTDDPRIEILEVKVAHLERALQDLSDVLFRHQQLIDALQARQARLLEPLEPTDGPSSSGPQFEIPPHY